MSVRDIGKEEIKSLFGRLIQDRDLLRSCGISSEQQLAETLMSVYAANKAAQFLTYGEFQSFEAFDPKEKASPEKISDRELFEALGNLLYNCISNGGKCFLPPEQKNQIIAMRLALGRRAFQK